MRQVSDVLYLHNEDARQRVLDEMLAAGGQQGDGGRWVAVSTKDGAARFHLHDDIEQALSVLSGAYYNFLVVDARHGTPQSSSAEASLAHRLATRIHYAADPDLRYPLSRMIAILDDDEAIVDSAFALGKLRIGGLLCCPFPDALLTRMIELTDPDPGKTAICLAGGGVEGFLFEVGVMKAINAHLQNRTVNEMDIFCGISAGAILAALLANNTEVDSIEGAFTNPDQTPDVEPVTPSVIYDPHLGEYASRIWTLAKSAPVRGWSNFISGLLKTVPVGFFRGDGLERFVEAQLTQAGRTNDFRKLKRELYIGATDQDTSAHVVFGDGQWDDVPISRAVRASAALTPFFEPAEIKGRYFVDGQYTRTSNFHLAIERGAKLVIIVDPLVPIRVDVPGYVRSKGGVFAALQALKAVIHSRFMHGFQAAADDHPNVDFVLFRPEGDEMRLLSGSPMKYNLRLEILNMAYRCGVRKIQRDFEILRGTFAKHGFELQRYPRLRTPPREVY
ncbi:MAG: patatin-like phospholipase family protein [Deltaproteobacteria bacterium]|nr:patatin-like phospholipase family protein [Deltaproteobacteria bacterium]